MGRKSFVLSIVGGFLLAAGAGAVTLPRTAGEVPISLPNGKQELLSKYRGKVVILSFLLST